MINLKVMLSCKNIKFIELKKLSTLISTVCYLLKMMMKNLTSSIDLNIFFNFRRDF